MGLVLHVEITNWQVYLHEYEQRIVCNVPWSSADSIDGSVVCSVLDSDLVAGASELSAAASASHSISRSFPAFSSSVPLNIKIAICGFRIIIY